MTFAGLSSIVFCVSLNSQKPVLFVSAEGPADSNLSFSIENIVIFILALSSANVFSLSRISH